MFQSPTRITTQHRTTRFKLTVDNCKPSLRNFRHSLLGLSENSLPLPFESSRKMSKLIDCIGKSINFWRSPNRVVGHIMLHPLTSPWYPYMMLVIIKHSYILNWCIPMHSNAFQRKVDVAVQYWETIEQRLCLGAKYFRKWGKAYSQKQHRILPNMLEALPGSFKSLPESAISPRNN